MPPLIPDDPGLRALLRQAEHVRADARRLRDEAARLIAECGRLRAVARNLVAWRPTGDEPTAPRAVRPPCPDTF